MPTGSVRRLRTPNGRGQATVEAALLLPLLALLLLAVAQAGVVVRDQVHLTRATSAAARAAMVDPSESAARSALLETGGGLAIEGVSVRGSRSPGSLLTVSAVASPTRLPLVGGAVGWIRLRESLVVRVEG